MAERFVDPAKGDPYVAPSPALVLKQSRSESHLAHHSVSLIAVGLSWTRVLALSPPPPPPPPRLGRRRPCPYAPQPLRESHEPDRPGASAISRSEDRGRIWLVV